MVVKEGRTAEAQHNGQLERLEWPSVSAAWRQSGRTENLLSSALEVLPIEPLGYSEVLRVCAGDGGIPRRHKIQPSQLACNTGKPP